ncbi:MAG: cytochrome P450, partial [Mycobacterium gordonae]|nr:cytochrome P450 [Mycobacterium gordonae]
MQIEGILPATSDNKPDYCDIQVSSKSFWARPALQMDEVFAQLRAEHPVSWQRPIEGAVVPDPDDPGFWAVVRHVDIKRVSHDNQTFVSGQGVFFDRLP